MELRVLEYFLAVAREGSILGASHVLHLTQPTLSRQMKDLENEIGKQLFVRSNRKITLTEEGILLRKRAMEIITLVKKTETELAADLDTVTGTVYLSCAEMDAFRLFSAAMKQINEKHPNVQFQVHSGHGNVSEWLDHGLLDFGLFIEPADVSKYDYIYIPNYEKSGVLMRKDCPLAKKEVIHPEDLRDKPLIVSEHFLRQGFFSKWLGISPEEINIAAIVEPIYNAAMLVKDGIGYYVSINFELMTEDKLHNDICFRPLEPPLASGIYIVWKKYQVFSKAAELFLEELQSIIQEKEEND